MLDGVLLNYWDGRATGILATGILTTGLISGTTLSVGSHPAGWRSYRGGIMSAVSFTLKPSQMRNKNVCRCRNDNWLNAYWRHCILISPWRFFSGVSCVLATWDSNQSSPFSCSSLEKWNLRLSEINFAGPALFNEVQKHIQKDRPWNCNQTSIAAGFSVPPPQSRWAV